MKHRLFILTGFLFIGRLLNAQTDFRPGYIVTLNNDTIVGSLDYRGDKTMGEVCRFKTADYEKTYTPTDILEYRFTGSKYFVSKELNGKKVFLEFLIQGQINIYYLRDVVGNHYYLEKNSSGIVEIPYEEGIEDVNNTSYFYETKTHLGILNYFMQDAPGFQKEIAKMGKPEHNSLIKLAEDYHNQVCKDRACMIYEKKLELFKLNLEISGGLVNYQLVDNILEKTYFQGGIITHIWMPRVNENWYFRSGLQLSSVHTRDGNVMIYKIPLQLEYLYPTGNIRPVFAFGLNLYKPDYHTLALSGGLNIKLDKSSYWSIMYGIDFNPINSIQILPESVFSQTISTGIVFKL